MQQRTRTATKWQNKHTHMGFGPENEDFSNHSEQLLCIWVWTCQPSCSASEQIALNILKVTNG